MNILVAEDEPKVQRGLVKIINTHNELWRIVKVADNGMDALQYVYENEDVDVLITDIRMPELDGLKLISKIRELEKKIEIIILSGYEDFNYAKKAVELGVKRYITKPTNPKEVTDCLTAIELCIAKPFQNYSLNKDDGKDILVIHSQNPFIEKILEYLHLRYEKRISLEDIAETLYLNPSYICEIFKKETGKTIFEYLADYRVKIAKTLLKDLRYKVSEVCEMVGYQDAKYFSQVFKKATGITPIEFRQNYLKIAK